MTPILGPPGCTQGQAERWLESKGAPRWAVALVADYWRIGAGYGVRPDVALALSCHETGFFHFTGVLTTLYRNVGGIKRTTGGGDYDPRAHHTFLTWQQGIRAVVEHLHAYAKGPVPDPVDPRHFPRIFGIAPNVEDLAGKWTSHPHPSHGHALVRNIEEMAATMTDSPGVTIIGRAAWKAGPPRGSFSAMDTPTPELWLHHLASEHHGPVGMRAIQAFHQNTRGWKDIAYSFCVDENGDIYEGRGAGVMTGATKGRNSVSHAICLMGNYDVRPLPKPTIQATAALVAHGHEHGWWPPQFTGGHRDAPGANTACPGRYAIAAIHDINALAAVYLGGRSEQEDIDDMLAFYLRRIELRYRQWGQDPDKDPSGLVYWADMVLERGGPEAEQHAIGALAHAAGF